MKTNQRKKLSWKPVRRGDIYCSPACGGGCRWSNYQHAVCESKRVGKLLGPRWKPRVWENLGWHWSVELDAGTWHLTLHGSGISWSCMIGTMKGTGSPGFYARDYFDSPLKAVEASVKIFNDRAEEMSRAMTLIRLKTKS